MFNQPRRTLLLFPGIFGEEPTFTALCAALTVYGEVRIVPYPGLTSADALLMDLDATAASLASGLLSILRGEPAHVVGYSYGANLAFAVAGRLQAAGARVALLALLDPALPTTLFEVHQPGPARDAVEMTVPRPELLYRSQILRSAMVVLCRLATARLRHRVERRTLWKLRSYARRTWRPVRLRCPVLHVMTEQFAPAVADGWASLCPEIRQVGIGDRHVDLLRGAALSEVVAAISAALDRAGPELDDMRGADAEDAPIRAVQPAADQRIRHIAPGFQRETPDPGQ